MSSSRLVLPLLCAALVPAAAASAAPLDADLDATYAAGAGIGFADFESHFDLGQAAAAGPAGSVYVAGTGSWWGETPPSIIAARFAEDGSLANVIAGPEGSTAHAGADAAGRLHVAGMVGGEPFALVRFTPAGEVDGEPTVVHAEGAENARVYGVHVDPDGSSIAVGEGYGEAAGGSAIVIARVDPAGAVVGTTVSDPLPDGEEAGLRALRQPGHPNSYLVASRLSRGDNYISIVTRHGDDGAIEPAFGVVESQIDGTAFATGPDGEIVIASGGNDVVYFERYSAEGELLKEWHLDLGEQVATAAGLAVQPDGKIVVAGAYGDDSYLLRFTAGGVLEQRVDITTVKPHAQAADLVLTAKGPVLAGTAFEEFSEASLLTLFAARINAPVPGPADPGPQPQPQPSPTPAPPRQEVKGAVIAPQAVQIADVVSFPSARRCVSRRKFRIRLRERRGITTVQATVHVNGRRVSVVRGKRLRAPVDLRRLPKGRFTVKIALNLADGRTVTGTRRYRTCTKKQAGRRRIKV